jgi:hypothetical protein
MPEVASEINIIKSRYRFPSHGPPRAHDSLDLPPSQFSVPPQQLPRIDLQPLSNSSDVVDRHIAFRAFDATQIGAVDATLMGQRFLREPALGAQQPHVLRQDVPERAFVRPFHGRKYC